MHDTKAFGKPKRFQTASKVKLVAGHEKDTFVVHQTLLCRRSHFFANAFKGNTKTMKLPDVQPSIMRAFVSWLYDETLLDIDDALELYVFADSYRICQLKNDALTTMYKEWIKWCFILEKPQVNMETLPGAVLLDFAIDNLPPSSRLLQLMFAIHGNWSGKLPECHDWDELRPAMCRLVLYLPWRPWELKELSEYLEDEAFWGSNSRDREEAIEVRMNLANAVFGGGLRPVHWTWVLEQVLNVPC